MTPFEIADALRACLEAVYEDDAGAPAEICQRPGDQVPLSVGLSQDECCSGLAWVRVVSIEPVIDPLTSEDPAYNPCNATGRRVTFELGVARCNPFGTNGAGPTCDEWTALALRMDQDARAMRRAVCCFNDSDNVDDMDPRKVYRILPGTWVPLESSGGCAGGTMNVVVWTNCDDC